MIKLSIEEKAKAYDEVREKIAIRFGSNVAKEIFSEYEESEDEKIRKWIIKQIKTYDPSNIREEAIAWLEKQGAHANFRNNIQIGDKVTRNQDGILVNLSQLKRVVKPSEKQCEQKPTDAKLSEFKDKLCELFQRFRWYKDETPTNGDILEYIDAHIQELFNAANEQKSTWSEEDELKIDFISKLILGLDQEKYDSQCMKELAGWIKSLKERVQPNQEWSEEDEEIIKNIIAALNELSENILSYEPLYQKEINWLKSLKPQNRWKPSEEQIIDFENAINDFIPSSYKEIRISMKKLLEQLKKLK